MSEDVKEIKKSLNKLKKAELVDAFLKADELLQSHLSELSVWMTNIHNFLVEGGTLRGDLVEYDSDEMLGVVGGLRKSVQDIAKIIGVEVIVGEVGEEEK